MTSVLGAAKAAEEFAAALEGRLPLTELRPELADLVGLTETLRAQGPPPQRAGFPEQLRANLVAEAARTRPTAQPDKPHTAAAPRGSASASTSVRAPSATPVVPSHRRRTAAIAALILAAGVTGTGLAAREARPGEALYPLKRALEDTAAVLSPDAEETDAHLQRATTRLQETQLLLKRSPADRGATVALEEFTGEVDAAAARAFLAYRSTGDTEGIQQLQAFTARSLRILERLERSSARERAVELRAVAGALLRVEERAEQLCHSCDGAATR